MSDKLLYLVLRLCLWPLAYLPFSWLHALGRMLGSLCYHCMHSWRKRALSHIALATDLQLTYEQTLAIAKQSFQSLAITCLEYPKLAVSKHLSDSIRCENPEVADQLHAAGHGIVFFCGHQANWEVLFLDGTQRMKGVAIGKPIKNKQLYQWIVAMRERFGGKIISPKNALRESLRALKQGTFLGIVADQAMPDSRYSFPFLGRRAFNSTAPALLAYKTNSPLMFAETRRVPGGYRIRYSDPIWPDLEKPLEEEVVRMMDCMLQQLQDSIRKNPGQWLWQHNRWKQQTPQVVYYRFRHDAVCVVLPEDAKLIEQITVLRQIYPLEFLMLFVPETLRSVPLPAANEVVYYRHISETLKPDLRPKLVLDFTGYPPLKRHYRKLSALDVVSLDELKQLAKTQGPIDDVLKRALCRPGTLWRENAV